MNGNRCVTRGARVLLLLVLAGGLAQSGLVWAQPQLPPNLPQPRVFILSPGGGKAGSTVEVAVTGQDIDAPQGLLFSHPGIKADPLDAVVKVDPRPNAQPRNQGMGPLATTRFKVTIPADVPLGHHDLRLVNSWGVSNPRVFVVSDQTEVVEQEPNNDLDQAHRVELNTAVSGTLSTPTDVDYFVFAGKKGQRVVVSCLATSLDSRALPALQLFSSKGSMLASSRDYHYNDALLDNVLAEDGDYYVRVFSFTYTQGGVEHFYRLNITTAPWIDAVFPPVVMPGQDNTLTVYGRNLPGGQPDPTAVVDGSVLDRLTVTVKVPRDPAAQQRLNFPAFIAPRSSELDGFAYQLRNESGQSNPYLLTYARAPVVLDQGDNDTPDKAQKISMPCEIAGRIEKQRDRDWYRFDLRKGENYVVEVLGDRLGSNLDMYFTLKQADAKGNGTEYDDNPEILHPLQFFTRTEDPARQRFTAPADGTYLLQVASKDADVLAGPRQLYRVRITPEQPDFRLIVMPFATKTPAAEVVHAGDSQSYTVLVWRQDGFEGPITLSVEGLPSGVKCPPQYIGAGQKMGSLVVSAATDAKPWTGLITVKGTATIEAPGPDEAPPKTLVREARPASITWPTQQQQNIPAISRLDRALVLAVRDKGPFALKVKEEQYKVLPGEKVQVALKLDRLWPDFKGPVQVTLANFPNNVLNFNNNQPLTIAADKTDATAVLDVRPGLPAGNYTLALRAQATVSYARDPKPGSAKTNLTATAASVPITLTILSKDTGGAITLSPSEATVTKGSSVEVLVKVNRQADVTGELKVQLVIPGGVQGVSAADVVIPAGRNQARLVIKAESMTNSGIRNLQVRITGMRNGNTPISQEARLTVTVMRPAM